MERRVPAYSDREQILVPSEYFTERIQEPGALRLEAYDIEGMNIGVILDEESLEEASGDAWIREVAYYMTRYEPMQLVKFTPQGLKMPPMEHAVVAGMGNNLKLYMRSEESMEKLRVVGGVGYMGLIEAKFIATQGKMLIFSERVEHRRAARACLTESEWEGLTDAGYIDIWGTVTPINFKERIAMWVPDFRGMLLGGDSVSMAMTGYLDEDRRIQFRRSIPHGSWGRIFGKVSMPGE